MPLCNVAKKQYAGRLKLKTLPKTAKASLPSGKFASDHIIHYFNTAMDPLTAFSLACGIVQFVDFSSKLVSKGYEISISAEGALAENLDLETVTTDLS
jgi:hypothetical protein